MDSEIYRNQLQFAWVVAGWVSRMPAAEMLEAAERADAVGPLLDPTLYIEKGKALAGDIALLRALVELKNAIGKIPGANQRTDDHV